MAVLSYNKGWWKRYKEEQKKFDEDWEKRQREMQEKKLAEQQKAAEDEEKCKVMKNHIMEQKVERADIAESSETGSTDYLKARYGDYAYRSMLAAAAKELDCTEENAAAFLTEHYSEDLWKAWEDDDVEMFLGNR